MSDDYAHLNELFSRDPLSLTKEDRSTIIEHMVTQKHRFDAAALEGKKPSRAKAAPKAKGTLTAGALDLLSTFKL